MAYWGLCRKVKPHCLATQILTVSAASRIIKILCTFCSSPLWKHWIQNISNAFLILLYGGSIYLGAKNRWFASRESLAKGRSINDLKSRDEIFRWDAEFAAVGNALLKARDERLIECLQIQLNKFQTKGCRIAIIYGASHIAAVLRELRKNGNYRSVESEWLTVFNLWSAVKLIFQKDSLRSSSLKVLKSNPPDHQSLAVGSRSC